MNEFLETVTGFLSPLIELTGMSAQVLLAVSGAVPLLLLVIMAWIRRQKKLLVLPADHRSGKNLKKLKQAEKLLASQKENEAAEIFAQVGMVQNALKLYKKNRNFKAMGELYIAIGEELLGAKSLAQAGQHDRAARLYYRAGKYDDAANHFRTAGMLVEAAGSYEMAGAFGDAAASYEQTGKLEEAAGNYARAENWSAYARTAAMLLDNLMRTFQGQVPDDKLAAIDFDRALQAAESHEQWNELFAMASFQLQWGKAALASEKRGDTATAIELYRRASELDQSARLLLDNGQPQDAELDLARHHESLKEWKESAQHYLQAGQLDKAVEVLLQSGHVAEAAEMNYNQGRYEEAGDLNATIANYEDAGQAYLLAGMKEKAADNLVLTGQKDRAAALYLETEFFRKAGEIYLELGQTDAAVGAYQKHLRKHPDDSDSALTVATLLEEKELFTSAAETYNNLIGGRPVNEKNITYYYRLGRVTERMKRFPQAKLIYEKLLAFDLNYEDVPERITSLSRQEVLADLGGGSGGGSGGGHQQAPSRQRYNMIREIGKGGMGTVYLAEDSTLERNVALKVLNTASLGTDAIDKLMEEARISAGLMHANIVTVFDVSLIGEALYLSMEYVDGQTLRELVLENGPLPITPFLLLFGQACQGLAFAHQKGVVHRDIKPANMIWTADRKLKIMDFGLACAIQEMANTQTVIVGTPHYMSPEQVMGNRVDTRSDIYSLGVTMFEAATGERPFKGGDVGYHHVHTEVPDPVSLRTSLPVELGKVIMRCMRKKPEDRYQDANDVFEEMKAIMQKISRG